MTDGLSRECYQKQKKIKTKVKWIVESKTKHNIYIYKIYEEITIKVLKNHKISMFYLWRKKKLYANRSSNKDEYKKRDNEKNALKKGISTIILFQLLK